MFYVYALKSNNYNRIYIGSTKDLDKRIKEHNSGETKSTSFYRPWALFYSEKFNTRTEARVREKKLKSGSGREFLRKLIMPL